MPSYTPWTWSPPHGRHYSYLLADDGRTILETLWSGPSGTSTAGVAPAQPTAHQRPPATTSTVPRVQDGREDESDEEEEEEEEEGEESDEEPEHRTYTTAGAAYNHLASPGARSGYDRRQDSMNAKQFEGLNISPAYAPGRAQGTQVASTHAAPSGNRPAYNYTNSTPSYASRSPPVDASRSSQFYHGPGIGSSAQAAGAQQSRSNVTNLPVDIQAQLKALERRYIRTDPSTTNEEFLDSRYRRVALSSHTIFFIPGRVFKMLWTEPAGQVNPGKTRNSTHFSTIWLGEQAYSEIRHFIVIRNKGSFSQCIPVQTYRGLGAAKPGLVMEDHGIIHTTPNPPDQLANEALTKYSIRVQPTKTEILHPASRVNYGKAYAVEHNVKVLDIGMVVEQHRYLLSAYFDEAMRTL